MELRITYLVLLIALVSFVKANVIDIEDETTKENASQVVMPVTSTRVIPKRTSTNYIIPTTATTSTRTTTSTIRASSTSSININVPYKDSRKELHYKSVKVSNDVEEVIIRCVNGSVIPEGKKTICAFDNLCYSYYSEFVEDNNVCGIYIRKSNDPIPSDYATPSDICRITSTYYTYSIFYDYNIGRDKKTYSDSIVAYETVELLPNTLSFITTLCKESISEMYSSTFTPPTTTTVEAIITDTPTSSIKPIDSSNSQFTDTFMTFHVVNPQYPESQFYLEHVTMPATVTSAIGRCTHTIKTAEETIPRYSSSKRIPFSKPTSYNLNKREIDNEDNYLCDKYDLDCYGKLSHFEKAYKSNQYITHINVCDVYTYKGKYDELSTKTKSVTSICTPTDVPTDVTKCTSTERETSTHIGEDQIKTEFRTTTSYITVESTTSIKCKEKTGSPKITTTTTTKSLPPKTTPCEMTTLYTRPPKTINQKITTLTTETTPVKTTMTEKEEVSIQETVYETVKSSVTPTPDDDQASCAAKWEQCGGNEYKGPRCCQSGSTCKEFNQYYSQCI